MLAEKLVHNAIENDESWAFSMIYDRLEGKAVQPIEVSDADTIPANAIASLVDQHGRMKLEALKPPRLTNQIRAYLADVADGR